MVDILEAEETSFSSVLFFLYVSGRSEAMFSNSLTTSRTEGLSSVSSREHLSANAMNFLMESVEQGPMFMSIMDNIVPDSHAAFTWKGIDQLAEGKNCAKTWFCAHIIQLFLFFKKTFWSSKTRPNSNLVEPSSW